MAAGGWLRSAPEGAREGGWGTPTFVPQNTSRGALLVSRQCVMGVDRFPGKTDSAARPRKMPCPSSLPQPTPQPSSHPR